MQKTPMLIAWMRPSYDPYHGPDDIIGYVESEKELDRFLTSCQAHLTALNKRYEVQDDNSVMVVELGNIENKRFVPLCKLKIIMLLRRASAEIVQALNQALRGRLKKQMDKDNKKVGSAGELPCGREWPPWR